MVGASLLAKNLVQTFPEACPELDEGGLLQVRALRFGRSPEKGTSPFMGDAGAASIG